MNGEGLGARLENKIGISVFTRKGHGERDAA